MAAGRDSSENAIYSIYSMYGDEHLNNLNNNNNNNRASSSWAPIPVVVDHNRTSYPEGSDLPYYADIPEIDPPLPPPVPEKLLGTTVIVAASVNTSPRGSFHTVSSARPPSSYATPSLRGHSDLFEDSRQPPSSTERTSDLSASSHIPNTKYSGTGSPNSRRSSQRSPHAHRSLQDLPPLPPSTQPTPSHTPPPQLPPSVSPPPAVLLTPKKSIRVSAKNSPSLASPSSKVSLVPSEGEDCDAFHVRNTYAQLEATGVKGDGYEEGIERTRARVGTSRTSQLQADAALADANEKSRELDVKEVQVLKSVDRYGFFTIPSHDRLVLLNSPPLLKRLALLPTGPPTAPSAAITVKSLPPVSIPPKEAARIAKWGRMLIPLKAEPGVNAEGWHIKPSKESKLRERTYKGVPDRWRRAAWDLLMSRHSHISPRGMDQLGADYREALDKPSTYDIQIDLDVPRTISGHIMFRTRYGAGQRSLFHVLHSFSLRCPTCGYVQGMGPIAATLLCYFEPERVYASLVILHDAYKLHSVFNPGFPGLLEAIYVQERITEQMMPAVYASFKKHMISTTSYATKWYITLFANSVPFQTQLRLWDAFLLEGYDLFIAVAIAIVWVYRDHITSNSANFETVLSLLSSFFVPEDEDSLMSWIESMLGDKKLRANMLKWKLDWTQLIATGKDGNALL